MKSLVSSEDLEQSFISKSHSSSVKHQHSLLKSPKKAVVAGDETLQQDSVFITDLDGSQPGELSASQSLPLISTINPCESLDSLPPLSQIQDQSPPRIHQDSIFHQSSSERKEGEVKQCFLNKLKMRTLANPYWADSGMNSHWRLMRNIRSQRLKDCGIHHQT